MAAKKKQDNEPENDDPKAGRNAETREEFAARQTAKARAVRMRQLVRRHPEVAALVKENEALRDELDKLKG